MSRSGSLDNPDFVLIDLDPQECPYDMIVEAAVMVKEILDRTKQQERGLKKFRRAVAEGFHEFIHVEVLFFRQQALQRRLAIAHHLHRVPFGNQVERQPVRQMRFVLHHQHPAHARLRVMNTPHMSAPYEAAPTQGSGRAGLQHLSREQSKRADRKCQPRRGDRVQLRT